jgi:hypothetical protein
MTVKTGQLGKDSRDKRGLARPHERENCGRSARTGQPDRVAGTGQTDRTVSDQE